MKDKNNDIGEITLPLARYCICDGKKYFRPQMTNKGEIFICNKCEKQIIEFRTEKERKKHGPRT